MSLSKISAREASTLPESSHDIGDSDGIKEPDSTSNTDSDNNDSLAEAVEFQEVIENDNPTIGVRMLNFCRELAIFCLIMVTLEALTKNPPKVTKPPAAYPFFSQDSIVTDWYRGQISKAIEQARSSDIAFVMFYAPWDAESQAARKEFEAVAEYMQDFVTFTAVNCWQPNSECRNQYNKVYRWPVLIAYPSHGRGVQYSGPISTPHLIRFLQKVCRPFMRFSKENLKESEDAYIVAHMNTLPGSRDFAVLYTTALKYLEKDPLHTITFYVNPQPVSEPSLHLHLWNETLIYPIDNEWRSDEILQWLLKHFHYVTSWVAPSGTKSLVLSGSLQPGPALILFTPRNPLHVNTDYYSLLQEIGYEYYNCDENAHSNLHIINEHLKRSGNLLRHRTLKLRCRVEPETPVRQIMSHMNPKKWANTSNCKEDQSESIKNQKENRKDCNSPLDNPNYLYSSLSGEECIEFPPVIKDDLRKPYEGHFVEFYKTSILTGENDPRSPESLLKLMNVEKCRQFLAAEKYQPAIFEKKISDRKINITGLACKTNASLTLIAMDSLLYYHFALRLGIDLQKIEDKSALVILSEEMESHYVMKVPINGANMREFVQNFTNNQLPRSLDSYSLVRENDKQNSALKHKVKDREMIFIEELNTNTFLPKVLQENMAVVVFYYSKQCAFCSGISFVLLTVARKFSFVENLSFYRIDGDFNNLPWEYTMESFPTILFFPAYTKSESRVYPQDIPITVPNLIRFILGNLESSIRLHAMWSICNQTKFEDEKAFCLSLVQAETLTVIDATLRDWRKSNRRVKQALLHKLKLLKQLHLLIAHYPQNSLLVQSYFSKLNSKLSRSKDYHSREIINHKDEL